MGPISAAVLALAGAAGGAAATLPRVRVRAPRFAAEEGERRFFEVDSSSGPGRELQFKGVNVVYKDPPYYPNVGTFHANTSFVEEDVLLLKSMGINLVRLGVMWPGLMPSRRAVDHAYASAIREIINMCERHGIYTVIEPHQDELNPVYCGDGAPDWWVSDAHLSTATFPVPVEAGPFTQSPPGRELCDRHISFSYIWTKDAAAGYQYLYETSATPEPQGSKFGPFGEYWHMTATLFAGVPGVLAGELWNEPFPGDVYKDASLRTNANADRSNLQPWYANLTTAIREASEDMLVAYEPSWPVGDQDLNASSLLPSASGFVVENGKTNIFEDQIYAFHYYSMPCDKNLSANLDGRIADARRLRAAPYASEFNLAAWDEGSGKQMREQIREFEQGAGGTRRISYTGWQYKSYSGSLPGGTCTGCGNSFFNKDGSLQQYMANAIGSMPFAQAIAGEVQSVTSRERECDEKAHAQLRHMTGKPGEGGGCMQKEYDLTFFVRLGDLRKQQPEPLSTEIVIPGWWRGSGGHMFAQKIHVELLSAEGGSEEDRALVLGELKYKHRVDWLAGGVVHAAGGAPDLKIPDSQRVYVWPDRSSFGGFAKVGDDVRVMVKASLALKTHVHFA